LALRDGFSNLAVGCRPCPVNLDARMINGNPCLATYWLVQTSRTALRSRRSSAFQPGALACLLRAFRVSRLAAASLARQIGVARSARRKRSAASPTGTSAPVHCDPATEVYAQAASSSSKARSAIHGDVDYTPRLATKLARSNFDPDAGGGCAEWVARQWSCDIDAARRPDGPRTL